MNRGLRADQEELQSEDLDLRTHGNLLHFIHHDILCHILNMKIGEEFDSINSDAEFIWVIDPIDGTRSFIAGHKDFGTLIALLHNNKPVIGIINCPAHGERWVGAKNQNLRQN